MEDYYKNAIIYLERIALKKESSKKDLLWLIQKAKIKELPLTTPKG